jgi:hypothetical protein
MIVRKHKATLTKMLMQFAEVVLQGSTEIAAIISVAELTRISARPQ